jgi:hypothetical protein
MLNRDYVVGACMSRIGRYKLSELSIKRLFYAVKARAQEIPHSLMWSVSSSGRENRSRLRKFENIHKSGTCIIVANGPSLKKTNLNLISNEVTFGLNRIYLSFSNTTFRPTYYVTVNELILEQFSSEILQLDMPKFLNWNRRSYYDSHDPKVFFLKSKMVVNDFFQHDITKPLVVGATVTFVALQLAYYMGFQKAILVGLDHDYVEKGLPSQTETRTSDQDQSHFHPQYFPKGAKWQLPDLLRSEVDFGLARHAFEADGRKILDATIGGNCPVFERVNFSDLKFK